MAAAECDEDSWVFLDLHNPVDSDDDDDAGVLALSSSDDDDEEEIDFDDGEDIEEEEEPSAPPPKPLSGLFFHHTESKVPSYLAFDAIRSAKQLIPDPGFSVFSEKVTVLASTHGLVCVRGDASQAYYVSNPLTFTRVRLPPHHCDHWAFGDPAVVITFEEPNASSSSFVHDINHYHVVVAFHLQGGIFAFESFSSRTWEWTVDPEICAVEQVVSASGIGAIGSAFWRTTLGYILRYDPEKGCTEIFPAPEEVNSRPVWELGEMEGSLCVTCMDEHVTEVAVLSLNNSLEVRDGESRWAWAGQFEGGKLRNREGVSLLRSQGASEVVMWDPTEERVVVMDLEGRTTRTIGPLIDDNYDEYFIPYVGSFAQIRSITVPYVLA
ncbi:hypothetical protein GUJ93_ZPchr0009g262 [Zizania palustris]|uniref:Uncharacterized protein n=1 Tax=Zizania palustris TaxID=103762 RepID=A0A8J5VJ53_ZIZPA|nr:hypothetical protein GUJ93_ZPchr0009g262 [Zizania palustris]